MSTRFNSNSVPHLGSPGLADKTHQGTPDISIPSVGIEDVDVAFFSLFDKEISLQVNGENSSPKKVPVLFASGEKWAILKKRRALRDRNNSLILPLITIARTGVAQDQSDDIAGRGINQQTNELIIKRRLDKSDRKYQNLINRFLIRNQKNVAVDSKMPHVEGQLLTDREVGEASEDPLIIDGAWLADIKKNNIFETIVIPAPQFYTSTYEITLWTQYTQHMNQLLEQIISSFLPQANAWKLTTTKGYWFIAYVEGNTYDPENNEDDMSQEERMLKYKFTAKVRAYILPAHPSKGGVLVKRYVSSPIIKFTASPLQPDANSPSSTGIIEDPFLGADDPTLPLADKANRRPDQRKAGTLLYSPTESYVSDDPALASRASKQKRPLYQKVITQNSVGQPVPTYTRVLRVSNTFGETVIKPSVDVNDKAGPASADSLLGGMGYDLDG